MRKTIAAFALILALLCGCGTAPAPAEDQTLTIVATTYPIYLFASAVTEGVEGVAVERLNTGSVSCLHDYTLSMTDMKKLDKADVIVMNGAELEAFMEDALASSDAAVIDCSEGLELLENLSHHHVEEEEEHVHSEEEEHLHEETEVHDHADEDEHEHEDDHGHAHEVEAAALDDHGHDHGHFDPHYWMHPMYGDYMVSRLREALCALDPGHEARYNENAENAANQLGRLDTELTNMFGQLKERGVEIPGLITFHDGFQYFAWAYDLPLLESIEEEAGSEASAKEIVEITGLVKEHSIPVIFTEVNGSDATANAIARETGCQVARLSMCMDGPDDALTNYLDALRSNARAIVNGFAEEEIIP